MKKTNSQLAQEKAELLQRIQHQRQQLSQISQDWLEMTSSLDTRWAVIVRMRNYILLGLGAMALVGVQKPARFLKWAGKIMGLWGTIKLLIRLYK